MSIVINVEVIVVNMIEWFVVGMMGIVVFVYQWQYWWDIGGCEWLFFDICVVVVEDVDYCYFIGLIFLVQDGFFVDSDFIFIDGQQCIMILMLLVVVLYYVVCESDFGLVVELLCVFVCLDGIGWIKLCLYDVWVEFYEFVVLDCRDDMECEFCFDDNYVFFCSQIYVEEVLFIWQGLQKLEYVLIMFGIRVNVQQIFESLNFIGELLCDYEFIYNYILMGLSYVEQCDVEECFWFFIECYIGEVIGVFWCYYFVMVIGWEFVVNGEYGVYSVF